jgi:hypothetical protein
MGDHKNDYDAAHRIIRRVTAKIDFGGVVWLSFMNWPQRPTKNFNP